MVALWFGGMVMLGSIALALYRYGSALMRMALEL